MAGHVEAAGQYVKGIEDDILTVQVEDILEHWVTLSQNGKFHAILATSSIKEAID